LEATSHLQPVETPIMAARLSSDCKWVLD